MKSLFPMDLPFTLQTLLLFQGIIAGSERFELPLAGENAIERHAIYSEGFCVRNDSWKANLSPGFLGCIRCVPHTLQQLY